MGDRRVVRRYSVVNEGILKRLLRVFHRYVVRISIPGLRHHAADDGSAVGRAAVGVHPVPAASVPGYAPSGRRPHGLHHVQGGRSPVPDHRAVLLNAFLRVRPVDDSSAAPRLQPAPGRACSRGTAGPTTREESNWRATNVAGAPPAIEFITYWRAAGVVGAPRTRRVRNRRSLSPGGARSHERTDTGIHAAAPVAPSRGCSPSARF